jgi:hydroxypyruvate isomerase
MSPGLRFASHLGYLSVEEPLFRASVGSIDAVAHIEFAARLGFHGVLYPWVATRPDEEVTRVAAALDKYGMVAGCTAYAPLEVIPQPLWVQSGSGARSELLGHVRRSVVAARTVNSQILVVLLAGDARASRTRQRSAAIDNLRYVLDIAIAAGLKVAVEPMIAFPDMLLQTTGEALELIAAVNHPQFGLVFDTGHVAAMDGAENLTSLFKVSYDHVMALQLADLPGRVEVGGGVLEIGSVLLHAMLENFTGLVELEHQWSQAGAVGEAAGLERFRRIEAVAREEAMLSEPMMTKAMVRANGRAH